MNTSDQSVAIACESRDERVIIGVKLCGLLSFNGSETWRRPQHAASDGVECRRAR